MASHHHVPTTNEVWKHHINAWDNRSLDDIIADYTEQSILVLNNQIFRGLAEVRNVFDQLFHIFDDGKNIIDPETIVERVVYIDWRFTPTGKPEQFGSDSFVIENGKITIQTIASLLYVEFPIHHSHGKK